MVILNNTGYRVKCHVRGKEFEMLLAAVPLNELKPHEEVNRRVVRELARSLELAGVQKNPIIVDRKTGVILDGMHRWHALKLIGARYAVACLVDYSDPAITLGRWVRLYARVNRIPAWLRGWLGPLEDPEELLASNEAFVCLRGKARRLLLPKDKLRAFRKLKMIETWLRREGGGDPSYFPDKIPDSQGLVLAPPKLSKEEVVSVAMRGLVFPPKSTRHEIPVRPLYLNAPLRLLKSRETRDTVSEAIAALLAPKLVLEAPGGLTAEREYRESVLIFWGW